MPWIAPGFDVLISDLAMPDRDGYDLIRIVRERAPERGGRIPAVALSAYARGEDRTQAIAAGYDRFLAETRRACRTWCLTVSALAVLRRSSARTTRDVPARRASKAGDRRPPGGPWLGLRHLQRPADHQAAGHEEQQGHEVHLHAERADGIERLPVKGEDQESERDDARRELVFPRSSGTLPRSSDSGSLR